MTTTPDPQVFSEAEMDDDNLTVHSTDITEAVAVRLADAGLSPDIISYALDEPTQRIRGIILAHRPEPVPLLDEKLADGVRKLANAALREAHIMLEFGPTEQKMTIIKSMLGGLSRHVTTSSSEETADARREYEAMLFEMRTDGIPERDRIVRDHDIIEVVETDVTPSTPPSPADDQDEGH